MNEQKNKCCLCDKQAEYLVERKTFVEHRCFSMEYEMYCEEHYIQYREKEADKRLNTKESIKAERLSYLLEHIGTGASWYDFIEV